MVSLPLNPMSLVSSGLNNSKKQYDLRYTIFENSEIEVKSHNFAGANYPALDLEWMKRVLVEVEDSSICVIDEREISRADSTPQWAYTGKYDAVISRGVAHTVADPADFCEMLMRIAPCGFIETPSYEASLLGASPDQRWIVTVVDKPGGKQVLHFAPRPFIRVPFRHVLAGPWQQDIEFRTNWEVHYRNISHTQFRWNDRFEYEVEHGPCIYDPSVPAHISEACLDAAICLMRLGGVPPQSILKLTERAMQNCPELALVQNTHGCALWFVGRFEEARKAFVEACRIEPAVSDYRQNSFLSFSPQNWPCLKLLPFSPDEASDIEDNFGGKVYYAFRNYDSRLARDLKIRKRDKVVDIGGGQRPFESASISVDSDIFEGVHRQGLKIQRDRPLVCGDAQRLPFRDHAFDVACCRMVLEHVQDPASACAELQRVAKRGFLETPNLLWECVYGHPTHRWVIHWNEKERILTFNRRTFVEGPFRSAIVPFLYKNAYISRAFEVTFRNLATSQVTWDEQHPFKVVVNDIEDCSYDYLARPEDAVQGELAYSTDMYRGGLVEVAVSEMKAALRSAVTPKLRLELEDLRSTLSKTYKNSGLPCPFEDNEPVPNNKPASILETPILWHAPIKDPSGYADEARHFLLALHKTGCRPTAREIHWNNRSASIQPEQARILEAMIRRSRPPGAVYICHILGSHLRRIPEARVCVGRTMFETDTLPAEWVANCNAMDAIWVPSEFNRHTFATAGVVAEKLRVVPGAIDMAPYSAIHAPLPIEGSRGFNFLSLFDWNLRKGWDVLLKAYVQEFSHEEDVALILQVHSSEGLSDDTILEQAQTCIAGIEGINPDMVPDIILRTEVVPDKLMPALYAASDCYVMPTRGEGWGRPYMEAMASGKQIIATNWSGPTAFTTSDTALLLDYELRDVSESMTEELPIFKGHRCAEPSLTHLRQLMRTAFEEREEGRQMGKRARQHIEKNFTYEPIVKILEEEILRLF